jgi:histidinol-phosphate aminotransferase
MLADRTGVQPNRLIITGGGDDALYRACLALLQPGRDIVLPTPTFEMIGRYARLAGGRVIDVPWPHGAFPREAVLRAVRPQTAMVCVVSPNNPTGAVATADDVRALCMAVPHALILFDLAYEEYADEPLMMAALEQPNALIIRTLSKAWGLAGLRVGYAVGTERVIHWLRCAGNPFAVSGPSARIAIAWLREGCDWMAQSIATVRRERVALHHLLAELGAMPLPSQANFVLARFAAASQVASGLARLGIAVRGFPNDDPLREHLRITCPGNAADFDRLCGALRTILRSRSEEQPT